MKVWLAVIGFFVLFISFGPTAGCGGGSSGTSTTTTNTTGNFVRFAFEATKNGVLIDPTNIINGETVTFDIAGYTAANQRVVQPATGWQLDPTGQTEGTLNGSGVFTATASGGSFTVSVTAAGQNRTGVAQVKAAGLAIVTGKITDGMNPVTNLYGMTVDFYTSGSVLVGSSTSQGDGTFRAAVPDTAVTFEIRKSSIRPGFYKEYQYLTKWYLPQGVCRAPLPVLTNGTTTNLTNIVVPPTSFQGSSLPPPPPPSPCV